MLIGVVIIVVIVVIIIVLIIAALCNNILFYPTNKIDKSKLKDEEYNDLYVSVNDPHRIYLPGETRYDECINVWHFPHFCHRRRGHCDTTILYFHGNSGNISHRDYVIDICRRFNLNLLLVDYRGYGRSDGKPNATGIYQDGEAAYHYLTGYTDYRNIVIWGESLGGTVACHVASKYTCRALILLATFSGLEDLIDDMIEPKPLAKFVSWTVNGLVHPMKSRCYIQKIKCPVAIMHSQNDTLIPYRSAHILFDSIPHERKVLYTIDGDHASPRISEETLKQLFAFVGIQAECMDHHISYVIDTLACIVENRPDMIPEQGAFGVM